MEEYSTPGSVFQIPYPFLGNEVPGDRFLLSSDWETFKFVGRKEYASLHRMIMENLEPQIGVQGYKHIHLHGLLGWRKSHIACVLVTQLMAAGYRVIYAPDSKWVIADPWNYLRKSFYLAFADDEAALDMIDGCHSIDDLIRLSNTLAVKHGIEMVFVVDQVNAFGADSGDRTTEKLHQQLAQLTSEHISVQSSTGNFEIAGVALLAQEQVLKWSVYDGLDEVSILLQITAKEHQH